MPRKDATARKEYEKQYRESNIEKVLAYNAAYREKNKELIAEKRRLKAAENKEYAKNYRVTNKDNVQKSKKKYVQNTRANVNSYAARRRAEKVQRTPKWLSDVDFDRINNEYRLADLLSKLTGEPWHVDHVIPLKGKLVSGLHTPSNLRAIKGVENMKKRNEFEVSYA
jgi:hypothetical protein